MRGYFYVTSMAACALILTTHAFASNAPVPGPVAAVGAPAMLLIGGALLAVRYFRSRGK